MKNDLIEYAKHAPITVFYGEYESIVWIEGNKLAFSKNGAPFPENQIENIYRAWLGVSISDACATEQEIKGLIKYVTPRKKQIICAKARVLAASVHPFINVPKSHEVVEAHAKDIHRAMEPIIHALSVLVSIHPEPENEYQTAAYNNAAKIIEDFNYTE